MTIEGNQCPICGEEAYLHGRDDAGFGTVVQCDRCGKIVVDYTVEYFLKKENSDSWKFQACLYYYFTHKKIDNHKVYYILDTIQALTGEEQIFRDYNVLTYQEIMNLFPQSYSDKVDKIILNLSTFIFDLGERGVIEYRKYFASKIFFINDTNMTLEQIRDMILKKFSYLRSISLIQHYQINNGIIDFYFTERTWQRIDELQKNNRVFKKAFIAMSFDPSLQDIREAIKSAIGENGYLPDIIDEKEHNNEIMPEIYYAIQTSDFVVADLTHNRGGVYLEAGYALGLGKQVIFTVNETLQEKDGKVNAETPHFDVQQRNQIRYKDAEELKEKLIKRIEATMGLANVKK
ncbi:MAG: hypothetical protein ACC608_02370 [Anaerofustis sp.]